MTTTRSTRVGLRGKPGRSKQATVPGWSLGVPADNTSKLIALLEKGFPFTALLRFQKSTAIPLLDLAELIRLPQRSLLRRKAERRLNPDESERLLRLSRVFEHAVDFFEGDLADARDWLLSPSADFDDQPPLAFARTEVGARDVENLLWQLENGVFP